MEIIDLVVKMLLKCYWTCFFRDKYKSSCPNSTCSTSRRPGWTRNFKDILGFFFFAAKWSDQNSILANTAARWCPANPPQNEQKKKPVVSHVTRWVGGLGVRGQASWGGVADQTYWSWNHLLLPLEILMLHRHDSIRPSSDAKMKN